MAFENIFIGNRYVTKYMGNWAPTTQYEALSAVLYTDGNAYVSNKPVPAGTLPTETAYWALWGSGNAAIDALTSRLNYLEGVVSEARTQLDNLQIDYAETKLQVQNIKADVEKLISDVDILQTSDTQNKQNIQELQTDVGLVKGDISTINSTLAGTERVANKGAPNGYMGLNNGGFGVSPTYNTSPISVAVTLTNAQTLQSGAENVMFDTYTYEGVIDSHEIILDQVNGGFKIFGASQYYDVWISGSVLCVPTGGAGIKDVYVRHNSTIKYVVEEYLPNENQRVSISVPMIYVGAVRSNGQDSFGLSVINWAPGNIIGKGSVAPANYGSTWCNVIAYPRYLPVG